MMRIRIALVAAIAAGTLGITFAGTAVASNGTTVPPKVTSIAPIYTVHITGVGKNGKQFKGTYAIQRFVAGQSKVFAVGTLRGTLGGRHVTRHEVEMPVTLTGSNSSASGARAAQASQSCSILHLVLGPINLNLLGLRVTIGGGAQANQPIVVGITAVPGAGNLLGNLLCDLTNALNQGGVLSQLSGQLQQLSTVLNSLVGLLGGL